MRFTCIVLFFLMFASTNSRADSNRSCVKHALLNAVGSALQLTVGIGSFPFRATKKVSKGLVAVYRWSLKKKVMVGIPTAGVFTVYIFADGAVLTKTEFEEQTEPYFSPDHKKDFVGYASLSKGFMIDDVIKGAKARFDQNYDDWSSAFFYREKGILDLVEEMKYTSKAKKRHFTHLEIGGVHGSPGILHSIENLDTKTLRQLIQKHGKVSGLFAKGAKIRIHSCWLGYGDKGEEFLKLLGEFLFDQGGQVIGARRAIFYSIHDYGGEWDFGSKWFRWSIDRLLQIPASPEDYSSLCSYDSEHSGGGVFGPQFIVVNIPERK